MWSESDWRKSSRSLRSRLVCTSSSHTHTFTQQKSIAIPTTLRNPATDKQAAARVWRDGQKKRVFIYRLLATGTIEEKIFQRQISKEGLQNAVVENDYNPNLMSSDDLHDIFSMDIMSLSNTHDSLKCTRCRPGGLSGGVGTKCRSSPSIDLTNSTLDENQTEDISNERTGGEDMSIDVSTLTVESSNTSSSMSASSMMCDQQGSPSETEVMLWAHHNGVSSLKDKMLREIGEKTVSFVFELEVKSQPDATPKKKKKEKVKKKKESSTKKRSREEEEEEMDTSDDKENMVCTKASSSSTKKKQQQDEGEVRCILHNNTACGFCSYEVESK